MSNQTPVVSVIIVNYNGREHLAELLASLAHQERRVDEVIMVDNASSDRSVEFVRQEYPWVDVIKMHENVGFAAGNNVGIAKARGHYIALLNSDAVADEHWLDELLRAIESDDEIGAVVPKIYKAHAYPRLDCAGAEFNNLGFSWGRGANRVDQGQFESSEEVAAVTGCSVLLRRTALEDNAIFDAKMFMYYEELDLSIRLRGRGYSIVYVPTSIVHHKVSQGVSQVSRKPLLFQQFYGNRNRLKILLKYYPASVLLRNLPLIVLSLAFWNAYFLRYGGVRLALRAMCHQARFARDGLFERRQSREVQARRWLPWMTEQGLLDLLALRATFAPSSQP